jgi:hypothetical protein
MSNPEKMPDDALFAKAKNAKGDAAMAACLQAFHGAFVIPDQNPTLAQRRKLFDMGAIDFCCRVVQEKGRSDEVCYWAWQILEDAGLVGNGDDPAEDETVDRGIALGLLDLVVGESKFKPLRRGGGCLQLAIVWPSSAACLERHSDRLFSTQSVAMCLDILRAGPEGSETKRDIFETAQATLAALSIHRPQALLDLGLLETSLPVLALLASQDDNRVALGFQSARTIIRLVGKSESSDVIKNNPLIIDKLLYFFNGTLKLGSKSESWTANDDWDLSSLIVDLRLISISDANKSLLAPAIAPIAATFSLWGQTNQKVAQDGVETLMQLSFEPVCKLEIAKHRSAIEPVAKFVQEKNGFNKEICLTAVNLLEAMGWSAPSAARRPSLLQRVGASFRGAPAAEPAAQWIMISYNQTSAQPQALAVQKALKENGLPTWMDVFDMKSNLSDAMSDAVEGARAVLVFVTSAYKESGNCRMECEYAFEQKKKVVWVMSEANYKPNGWLGLKMGAALWFNGMTLSALQAELPKLMHEVAGVKLAAGSSLAPQVGQVHGEVLALVSPAGGVDGTLVKIAGDLELVKSEMRDLKAELGEIKSQLAAVLALLR